jgi:hypothetical protein
VISRLRRSAIRPRHRNAPRPAEKSAPTYLQWLRGRECFLAGHALGGCGLAPFPRQSPVEAAHVPHKASKGMATKSTDAFAMSLCQRHHDEQHNMGWATFQLKYGFNAVDVAGDYWSLWPGRRAWEAKQGDAA